MLRRLLGNDKINVKKIKTRHTFKIKIAAEGVLITKEAELRVPLRLPTIENTFFKTNQDTSLVVNVNPTVAKSETHLFAGLPFFFFFFFTGY